MIKTYSTCLYGVLLTGLAVISPTVHATTADDVVCVKCIGTSDITFNAINSGRIKNGEVKGDDIANNAITSFKIKNGEVKGNDIAVNAITSSKIKNGEVKSVDIANRVINESKLSLSVLNRIKALEADNTSQQALIDALTTQNAAMQEVLQYVSLSEIVDPNTSFSYPTLLISGANLQVVNGTGGTNNTKTGTGNLIVGYNEESSVNPGCSVSSYPDQTSCEAAGSIWSASLRHGSHNIIVGKGNGYSNFGGLAVGEDNLINGKFSATIGRVNTASGEYSIALGRLNTASGKGSIISGGRENTASGEYASVSGGRKSVADGDYSSISGGFESTANGAFSSLVGGFENRADGEHSSILGGQGNYTYPSGEHSTISGGLDNGTMGAVSSVFGGGDNRSDATGSTITGGVGLGIFQEWRWIGGQTPD